MAAILHIERGSTSLGPLSGEFFYVVFPPTQSGAQDVVLFMGCPCIAARKPKQAQTGTASQVPSCVPPTWPSRENSCFPVCRPGNVVPPQDLDKDMKANANTHVNAYLV